MTVQNDDIPVQIIPMILKKTVTWVKEKCFEEVPEDDPTRSGLVKMGLLQENPADKVVSIAINSGDYEDPDFVDAHIDHPEVQEFTIRNLPRGEIGGGTYWWRRFSIRVAVFFVRQNYDEELSIYYAYEFYGRLQRAIDQCQIGTLEDKFGERALGKPLMESTTFFQGGGKKKAIFRGKLRFRVLCWRP